jgi:PadR family transcriptional regulator PadR
VKRLSDGAVVLDPGTLYRHLGRLLDEELIAECDQRPDDDDPRRRYYNLTDTGSEALQAEAQRMEALAAAVRSSALSRPGAVAK